MVPWIDGSMEDKDGLDRRGKTVLKWIDIQCKYIRIVKAISSASIPGQARQYSKRDGLSKAKLYKLRCSVEKAALYKSRFR